MAEDLVQWLGEQLDEDADRATQWHDLECEIHARMDSGLIAAVAAARMLDEVPGAVCDCGGPARVLREIDAKRKALDHYQQCARAGKGGVAAYRMAAGAVAMQIAIMALPYAARPGYREEWRP
ncbi:DUF6221 family protein [Streptomyces sp. NPDC054871]